MVLKFSEDQEMLRKAAREFAEEMLAPRVEEIEEKDQIPEDIFKAMAERDFMGITVPEEYGGLNLGHVARMIVLEEISRILAAPAMMLQVNHLAMEPIMHFASEELKQKYLPALARGEIWATIAVTEATGGSDPTFIETVAKEDGDGYILNGRKVFITNSHISQVCTVLAKMADDPGTFVAFLVDKDTPGYKPGRKEKKMGFKGSETGDIILENCRVPRENMLGKPGDGLRIALGGIGEVGRAGMTGIALGILRACLDEAVKFANERLVGGKPISRFQAIQWKIAEIYTQLENSRLLAYRAAFMKDEGIRCDTEFAMAKYYSSEAAISAAKNTCDIHGGYGYMHEYKSQRLLRDAHMLVPSAGTTEIMKMIVARYALKNFGK